VEKSSSAVLQFRQIPGQSLFPCGAAAHDLTVTILYRCAHEKVDKSEELVAAGAEPKIVGLAPAPREYVHETWL
jgi:hypothetical protein